MTLKPGIRLGPYEVVSQRRFAGLGEIYQGRDHEHKRDVVIRVVRLDTVADPGLLQQLAADVLDTAALSHPSIPKIYEVGTTADTLYIVSEPFDGETLRTLLDGGPLSIEAASACMSAIEGALAVASEHGMSHGHLRAEDVLLTSDRRTLVLGFGLAAAVGGAGHSDDEALDALRSELLPSPPAARARPWWRRPAVAVVGLLALALGLGAFVTLSIQRARLQVQASRLGADETPARNGPTVADVAPSLGVAEVVVEEEVPESAAGDEAPVPLEEEVPESIPDESLATAEPLAAPAAGTIAEAPIEEESAEPASRLSDGNVAAAASGEPLVVADAAAPETVAAAPPVSAPSVAGPTPPAPVAAATPPEPPLDPVSGVDDRDARSLIAEAMVRVAEFDLPGAMQLLSAAAIKGDAGAEVGLVYVRGLVDAREAFRDGGTAEALAPVLAAVEGLGAISQGRRGSAEIARLVLQAAAAAAQSERDEMRLYLETAMQMEVIQGAAGLPGAPLVSATEIAGDLWLQVDRYEDARRAYADAVDRVGPSLRVMVGNARASSRLGDVSAACASYGGVLDTWGGRPGLPNEVEEARTYVEDACQTATSSDDQVPD
jgi:eukaryotic-like serine/threonine-protein kinase